MSDEQVKQVRPARTSRDRRSAPRNSSLDRRARARRKEAAQANAKRPSKTLIYLVHVTTALAVSAAFNFILWPSVEHETAPAPAASYVDLSERVPPRAASRKVAKRAPAKKQKSKRVAISFESTPMRGLASAHPPLIEEPDSDDKQELTVDDDFTVTLRPEETAAR
ncbi:MAG TPA: hypothetical protein VFV50_12270 [Bdellovibrionales bacterium]|nr:hypothetical protein [Bdellovibrionales bacterium]